MEANSSFKNRDGSRIAGGLILVAVGGALLMRNMGYFLPAWLFTWPVILILIGIYSGIKHNFRNNAWIILIGLGSFFLADRFTDIDLEPAFWPLIIIGIGILFILRPGKKKYLNTQQDINPETAGITATDTWHSTGETSPGKNDYLRIDSLFSGINRSVVSKNFQGGRISCVFGGAEIDLLQADITGNVILKVDLVFGGAKLLVPSHWTVISEVDGIFQNVEDKRRYNASVTIDPSKVLVLKGSAVFGGVEIKSF